MALPSKKLLLINPVGRRSGYMLSPFTLTPPLGLAYVAGVTPADWNVRIIDENFGPFEFEEADLVGITAFTANVSRAYEIAHIYRDKGTKVVMGGIHASMAPEEAMRYVDAVVVGEAEGIWPKAIRDFEHGRLEQKYEGPRVDLTALKVRPRRDLLHPGYLWKTVQTSRGCPFNCEFCSVTRYLGKEYRKRDVDDVLDELSGLEGNSVVFLDDNLIGHSRDERRIAEQLFTGMIERNLNKKWFTQTSINAADDERVLELAAKSGCVLVGIGFETIDESTLKAMKKSINLKTGVKRFSKAVEIFHKYGIAVMGTFIIGNDDEPGSYYERLADFMVHGGVDACQISILTPLPGTALMERIVSEDRLIYSDFPTDWDKFRMSYVTIRPKGTTVEAIYEGDNHVKKRLYSFPAFQWRMLKSLFCLKNPYAFYAAYKYNKGLKRSWQNSHYYKKVIAK